MTPFEANGSLLWEKTKCKQKRLESYTNSRENYVKNSIYNMIFCNRRIGKKIARYGKIKSGFVTKSIAPDATFLMGDFEYERV